MYNYDRRKILPFDLSFRVGVSNEGPLRLLQSKFVASVDGVQVGLLDTIEVKANTSTFLPEVKISLFQRISAQDWEKASPELKKAARETVSKLRRCPNVMLVCPEYLR